MAQIRFAGGVGTGDFKFVSVLAAASANKLLVCPG